MAACGDAEAAVDEDGGEEESGEEAEGKGGPGDERERVEGFAVGADVMGGGEQEANEDGSDEGAFCLGEAGAAERPGDDGEEYEAEEEFFVDAGAEEADGVAEGLLDGVDGTADAHGHDRTLEERDHAQAEAEGDGLDDHGGDDAWGDPPGGVGEVVPGEQDGDHESGEEESLPEADGFEDISHEDVGAVGSDTAPDDADFVDDEEGEDEEQAGQRATGLDPIRVGGGLRRGVLGGSVHLLDIRPGVVRPLSLGACGRIMGPERVL